MIPSGAESRDGGESGGGRGATASQWGADDPWTVLRMILWSAEYLGSKGVAAARLDAEHLLAHVLGVGRLQLYLDFERPLTPEELDCFRPLLKRRAAREPLQYVIGRHPFRDLDLLVRPGALVPRPETEVLVGEIADWLRVAERTEPMVLDIGTGTGAICLSLVAEGACVAAVATDISEAALEVAKANRERVGLTGSVELRAGSLFEPLRTDERFDVVASNPPYIAEVDEATLDPEVRDWEPHEALFGGRDGLDVIRGLVDGAKGHLRPGGLLAIEVGAGQAPDVTSLLEASGGYTDITVRKDYAGIERFVLAREAQGI